MNDQLLQLEREVIDAFLYGDIDFFNEVRKSIQNKRIERRVFTGVGFHTVFKENEESGCLVRLTDIALISPSYKHGAGFWLDIGKEGIQHLEGFTYDELWIDNISEYSLCYTFEKNDETIYSPIEKGVRDFAQLDYLRTFKI
jgi:hypothetical protein